MNSKCKWKYRCLHIYSFNFIGLYVVPKGCRAGGAEGLCRGMSEVGILPQEFMPSDVVFSCRGGASCGAMESERHNERIKVAACDSKSGNEQR